MFNCLQSSPDGITCLYLELSRLFLLRGLAAGDLLQLLLQGLQALLQFFLRVGSGRGGIWGWLAHPTKVTPFILNHLRASYPSHHPLIPLPSLPVIWGVNFWSLFLPPACAHHLPCSPNFPLTESHSCPAVTNSMSFPNPIIFLLKWLPIMFKVTFCTLISFTLVLPSKSNHLQI